MPESAIEARKIQRLGSSSLVVTLPRSWIKRHGIKPGDVVYTIDEGFGLKVIPSNPAGKNTSITLDLSRIKNPYLASMSASCVYIMGYDDVNIVFNKELDPLLMISNIKANSSRLLGVEVVNETDTNSVRLRVLLDSTRLDIKMAVKNLSNTISMGFDLLLRIAKNQVNNERVNSDIRFINSEIYKTQHLIIRQLVSSRGITVGDIAEMNMHSILVGTSLLGIIGDITISIANYMIKGNANLDENTIEIMERVKDLLPLIGTLLTSPSVRKSSDILRDIMELRSSIERTINIIDSKNDTFILSKLDTALRIMQIIAYTGYCTAIMSKDYVRLD